MQPKYTPHPAQALIHDASDRRFRIVCTGRRFGKTLLLAAELLDRGAHETPGTFGWVAPTYNVAQRGVEAFREISTGIISVTGRSPCRIDFKGPRASVPSCVWFLSADNAEAIRGYGFQGLVIDEAASIPEQVWHYVLRPTISQTLGWAVFVSTPKGRNWFYDLYTRGQDPSEKDYASFTFPSKASPFFPPAEWEEARRTLPADVFRQEYMAEFLEDSAGVFRGIDACLFDAASPVAGRRPDLGGPVVIGCDIAKHTDWTVCIAMDARSGRCLDMERFNQLDWPLQRNRIAAFVKRWNGRLVMDATGVGDPIYDDLRRVLPRVEPFRFSATSKRELVQGLMVAVEQRRVSWPATWEILTAELKRYEYEIGPTGQVSYAAPSGYHDDCVMALALGVWGCGRFGIEPGRMMRLGPRCRAEFGGQRSLTLV